MATDVAELAVIDEFEAIGRSDSLYEVVGGRRVEKPDIGAYEGLTATVLSARLLLHAVEAGMGRVFTEVIFLIDPATGLGRRPDVALVSYDRWPRSSRVPSRSAWNVVPDLAIEVVSPSNTSIEVLEKLEEYAAAGVRLVWLVYPVQELIHIWSADRGSILRRGDTLDGGEILPGFRLALADLFEGSDPG